MTCALHLAFNLTRSCCSYPVNIPRELVCRSVSAHARIRYDRPRQGSANRIYARAAPTRHTSNYRTDGSPEPALRVGEHGAVLPSGQWPRAGGSVRACLRGAVPLGDLLLRRFYRPGRCQQSRSIARPEVSRTAAVGSKAWVQFLHAWSRGSVVDQKLTATRFLCRDWRDIQYGTRRKPGTDESL